jgi:hypothetical protein
MRAIFAFAAGAMVLLSSPAWAEGLYLAGGNTGAASDYAFAGAILPLGGAVGSGPAVRLWSDYLDYKYDGPGGSITARGYGGALAGVYQFSGDWGWANLSGGVTYRDTHLSSPDPANRDRGGHAYFALQADGGYNLDDAWRARGLASYTPQSRSYAVQAGLDRAVGQGVRLGLDTAFQGGRNYREVSGGITAYFQIAPGLEIDPAAGLSHASGSTKAYVGVTAVLIDN